VCSTSNLQLFHDKVIIRVNEIAVLCLIVTKVFLRNLLKSCSLAISFEVPHALEANHDKGDENDDSDDYNSEKYVPVNTKAGGEGGEKGERRKKMYGLKYANRERVWNGRERREGGGGEGSERKTCTLNGKNEKKPTYPVRVYEDTPALQGHISTPQNVDLFL